MINFVWKLLRFLHLNLLHGNDKSGLNSFKLFAVTFIKALQKEINKDIASKNPQQLIKSNAHAIFLLHTLRYYTPSSGSANTLGFQIINKYCSAQMIQIYRACIDEKSGFTKTVHKLKLSRSYCESLLFFKTRRKEVGGLTQQIIFSLAAALSMLFAMLLAFWSQQKFGNFSTFRYCYDGNFCGSYNTLDYRSHS